MGRKAKTLFPGPHGDGSGGAQERDGRQPHQTSRRPKSKTMARGNGCNKGSELAGDYDDDTTDDSDDENCGAARADEADEADEVDEVSLLTLNCWGLPVISTLRAARLREIGRRIATLQPAPHIVCLQECWVAADYRAMREETRALLPHGKLYRAGPFGAGLAILSRWRLEETSMRCFPLNGRPTAFWRGDWYVGKGVACATVRAGRQLVHVFNTHTHAPYGQDADASYACHRAAQAWELAKLLRAAAAVPGCLVVALGDFNMLPLSLAHRIVTAGAPVRDVWRVAVPSAAFNLAVNGATSDGAYNTWRWTRNARNRLRAGLPSPVDPDAPDPGGKCLDYIFASVGRPDAARGGRAWVVKAATVALTERHPVFHVSLSDHFAVQATLVLHAPSPPGRPHAYDAQLAADQTTTHLPPAAYDELLATIRTYAARERRQRRWRALYFHAVLVVWAAALATFARLGPRLPAWAAFLLALVASLVLAAGLVDGLLALLFFSAELRSLREFRWEVRNARRAARAAARILLDSPSPPPGPPKTPDLVERAIG